MKVAFVIYEGMTALDFIGMYDPLVRLKTIGFKPDLQWDICSYSAIVKDSSGLIFTATQVRSPLQVYDMIVIP